VKTIVICGGNSGIGLEAARRLSALGHRLVLLGRDEQKGAAALAELEGAAAAARFLPVDVATHDGVRAAAAALLADERRVDVLLHTSGVLLFEDARTADGLHPFFAVNYLSRYHLTQLLLPALRASDNPRVVMLTSDVPLDTTIDFDAFPTFSPFDFRSATHPIQFGNQHYAAHLREAEPWILAGVVNAGVADTGIWRSTPPSFPRPAMNPVPVSAANPVALSTGVAWTTGSYWPVPGDPGRSVPLHLDRGQTARVITISRELTGA
jgi:NAD(P)-dependent dehydrogenase (short-subunit alcohol dehydrogenase family)